MSISRTKFSVNFSSLEYWDVGSAFLKLTNSCVWKTRQLIDIIDIRSDEASAVEISEKKVLLLDRISFDEGKIHSGKKVQTRMKQYKAFKGDIVVSKINARKGAIGIVKNKVPVCSTIHFRTLIPTCDIVDTKFLWLALRSSYCRNQFEISTGGQGKGEISEERLLQIEVPFPPLPIQQKIVEYWKSSKAFITDTDQDITKTNKKTQGRFIADLGLPLPKKIVPPKFFASNWKNFNRWSVSYNQTILSMIDLTEGKYPVVELGSILEMVQYGTSEKANTTGNGTPVLRMNNIKDGYLDFSDIKHINLPKKTTQTLLLRDGDILFNRTNSKELVGKCAVFHDDTNYVYASYIIRVRIQPHRALPDFIAYCINSFIGRKQINALSRQIIGQANINSQELRSLLLPLPPLDIQQKIMEHIEINRQVISSQKQEITMLKQETQKKIEKLILGTLSVEDL